MAEEKDVKKDIKETEEEVEQAYQEEYDEEYDEDEEGEGGKKEKEVLIARRNIYVDMWAFLGSHATNVGIVQKLKTAEDRQFTVGMDVNGKVSEDRTEERDEGKEDIAMMAIRSNLWEPPREDKIKALESFKKKREEKLRKVVKRMGGRLNAEQKEELEDLKKQEGLEDIRESDIDKKRLVIKMFSTTGKKIHWKGTIEELSSREFQNSLGSKKPLVCFNVILPGYDYLITIEQNFKYFRFAPNYSFAYWDEKQEKMWYFKIRQRFISVGTDLDVYSEGGKKVAFIDGKLIGLGGNSNIKIYDEYLAKDKKFADILILFTSSIGYIPKIKGAIRKRMNSYLNNGRNIHIIEDEEFWMMKNPRRMMR